MHLAERVLRPKTYVVYQDKGFVVCFFKVFMGTDYRMRLSTKKGNLNFFVWPFLFSIKSV